MRETLFQYSPKAGKIKVGLRASYIIKNDLEKKTIKEINSDKNIKRMSIDIFDEVVGYYFRDRIDEKESITEIEDFIRNNIKKYINKQLKLIENDKEKQRKVRNRNSVFFGSGIVYFVKRKSDNLIKIGCTNDFVRRLDELESKYKEKLEVLHIVYDENAYKLEQKLHSKFDKKRVEGEWFELTIEDIDRINRKRLYQTKDLEVY